MTKHAFAFITSEAVVVRTVASIRSLERCGALGAGREAHVYVLCLDDKAFGIIERTLPAEQVTPLSVEKDLPAVKAFADWPISRFAVACKPYLLRWTFEHAGAEKSLYFDSDIWFYSDPSFLYGELDNNDVLLTPYMLSADATMKDWSNIAKNAQRTGYYNAGFVGTSARATAFLDWWADRCSYSTFRDFYEDISGDQKYLNWAPSLFDSVKVMRHYGLNVKPWNTRYYDFQRQDDGTPTINNKAPVYFHFSQDLGNLHTWPQEFYPEVSRYLDDLEQARQDCGMPYVDMPQRDNSDLQRPLLPRVGKQAQLINLLSNYRKPLQAANRTVRAAVARGAHVLPPAVESRVAKQYLERWNLTGDATLSAWDTLVERLGEPTGQPIVFVGVSRLAFYLAYRGYPVNIFDPFQGHYNPVLDKMFNSQWRQATSMRDFLGVDERLVLHRVPVTEAGRAPAPGTLVIAARRTPDDLAEPVKALLAQGALKRLVTLFNPGWPITYRDTFRAFIQDARGDKPLALDHLDDVDYYTLDA